MTDNDLTYAKKREPSPASEEADKALLAAFRRIASNASKSGVQSLTIENVALEAGYSRATAYRSTALRAIFETHFPERSKRLSHEMVPADAEHEAEKEQARASRETELRLAVRQLSCRCVLLNSLLEKEKMDRKLEHEGAHGVLGQALREIERLREILGEGPYNVVQFPKTPS